MVTIFPATIEEFPPVEEAAPDGLLAIGGSYDYRILLKAYKNGIFPWFDKKIFFGNKFFYLIHWYSPDPRFVLFKEDFRIGKRLSRYYKHSNFKITFNKDFYTVIKLCQEIHKRKSDTWISNPMIEGYCELFRRGYAISVEVWEQDRIVGGLYGVNIGKYFCGESMFSIRNNASKFAFIKLAETLFENGYGFIDCQVYSEHFSRFGAIHIPRKDFLNLLKRI